MVQNKKQAKLLLLGFIISTLLSNSMYSQRSLAIGEWDAHLPYGEGKWVTQSAEEIIYSTGLSLLYIDKDDLNPRFVDKVKGLSDVGISRLQYDPFNDQLIIAYTNSSIDIVRGTDVFNLPFIKENTNILGDRQINDIYVADAKYAYLSTAFGIVQLDLQSLEFATTIFTELRVNQVSGLGESLFAATDDGLYKIDVTSNVNIGDFGQWQLLGVPNGLPTLYEALHTVAYRGAVYFAGEDILYKSKDGVTFNVIYEDQLNNQSIKYLSAEGAKLMVGIREDPFKSFTLFYDENDTSIKGGEGCINRTLFGIEDEQGRVWYSDEWYTIRHTDTYISGCSMETYNSPFAANVSDINTHKGNAYIASGGATESYNYDANNGGIYIYKEGAWDNINVLNNPGESGLSGLSNFFRVVKNPVTEKVYFGSFGFGLVEYDEETKELTRYNTDNSKLQGAQGDLGNTRITGLATDNQGNLWITNHAAEKPLVVYTIDGLWQKYEIPQNQFVANVKVDQQGYKWMVLTGSGGGVMVFDDNGTLADPLDDRTRLINSGNSELPTNTVRTLEVDKDGNVWVGTSEGAVVFECGASAFDLDVCRGVRRKVVVGGNVAFLLETEDVYAIETDGGNRKWFGSRNGIFVQSPDGEDQVIRYTSENSSLYDNTIIDLEFDEQTGVMWIASNKGLQSIKTETLGAEEKHASEVYTYPNPVRPDYIGPIAIKGLVNNANVKITDMNGRLVYETTALGGQAIWDGNDYSGRRADTGVYLVFSSGGPAFGTPDSFVSKIFVIK